MKNKDDGMRGITRIIQNITSKIADQAFISDHRAQPEHFTRIRTLSFQIIFMLILRKTLKSLQLSLNELFMGGHIANTVSASAYTQARKKFKHTAFIELNDDIIDGFYSNNEAIKTWNQYRCLAVDGSKIILPNTKEIKEEYGSIAIKNQSVNSSFSQAMFECCYDVLNHIAIKSTLAHGLSYEASLATEMLDGTSENDLLLYDRGYASYEFLATLTSQAKNYIIRCPNSSFKIVKSLTLDAKNWSKTVTLNAPSCQLKNIKQKGLPLTIKVRFVSVILSTGEIEILATSLMNQTIERDEFKVLYGMRWGVETFFSRIKDRLCLENFTGKTAESVRQDFWSTIFISNFETVAIENIDDQMNANTINKKHYKKVNKAVSFNVIKNMAFDVFMNNSNLSESVEKMLLLFKKNPILQRPERESPMRKKRSDLRSYNFLKRIKKMVF
ncbi:MAG: IS4 family transposase [Gammaproteobacteria bacterium]|nr:IS4 family transposase [Gammaproteobacteria bacterium]